jgi:hypothetical protein
LQGLRHLDKDCHKFADQRSDPAAAGEGVIMGQLGFKYSYRERNWLMQQVADKKADSMSDAIRKVLDEKINADAASKQRHKDGLQ